MTQEPAGPTYRQQLAALGNPPAGPLAVMAIQVWRAGWPQMVRELEAVGELEAAAIIAERDANNYIARLVAEGCDWHMAREVAFHECIYFEGASEDPARNE